MDTYALESFIDFCDDMEIAQEGIISGDTKMSFYMMISKDRKDAQNLMNKAKKLYKSGNYTQAISVAKKALAICQSMRKTASEMPDKHLAGGLKYADGSDTYKGQTKSAMLQTMDEKISTINAFIYKCQNAIKKRR